MRWSEKLMDALDRRSTVLQTARGPVQLATLSHTNREGGGRHQTELVKTSA
jgi:hypothetical protein